jgi:centrosomal protein CEP135
MDGVEERRYIVLRDRLRTLGYQAPFSVESMNIVERILTDLVNVSEAFRTLKEQFSRQSQESVNIQSQVAPLKKENVRLVRENNDLHMALVRASEELEQFKKKNKMETTRLEGELSDHRFLNGKVQHQVRGQTAEILSLKKRLDDLIEKTSQSHTLRKPQSPFIFTSIHSSGTVL